MTYTKIIRYSITLSIIIALVVLAGWIFHAPLLTAIIPGFPSMRPNTAICFLLLALAMLTQLVEKYAYIRYITLLLLFGLAELSLLETWLNVPLGIDELFFKMEQLPTATNPYPARIPGFSATCFLLFAVGLLIQSFRKSAFTQYIFHLITILGLIASFGYLFGVENMYSLSFLNSMTLHTSILFILLSIAASLFNPSQGLTGLFLGTTIGANMAKRLFPAFTFIIFGLGSIRIAAHTYNWISVELGIVLFAISFLICTLIIISYTAIVIDRVDEKRRNAERRLIISSHERLFKDVINNTSAAICIKNKYGEYVVCNTAFANGFNKIPEEIIGKTAFDLFSPETASRITANEPEMFVNGQSLVYENLTSTKNGTKIMLTNKFPIYDINNNISNIGVVATDITNEKKAVEIQQELAIKLQNRNNQLTNFAHITSHNLRSPVSNLVTLVDLLKRSINIEDKEFLLTKFDTVITRLAATLNDLIEALKIQEDSNQQKENLIFSDILNNVQEMLAIQIQESHTVIHTNFNVLHLLYPKTYLESIFLNLISNAIKYRSPNRNLEIKIESIELDNEIILTIKDNGLGIDLKKYGEKIFGFNKTFHRHPEAKGIGLFLTKTQIEAMGGSIRVESEPNIGTSFVINFKK
jgi:PAS domain S-box-containing protein